MRRVILILCLLAGACHPLPTKNRLPPQAFVKFKDRVLVQLLNWGLPVAFPCKDVRLDDQCLKYGKPQRWKGLWRDDFEGSVFCSATAKQCGYQGSSDVWLDVQRATKKRPDGALYSVDFIGRRSVYPGIGMYGHMGVFDEEIIVDRMISMKELEPPPPAMTEAEAEARIRSEKK